METTTHQNTPYRTVKGLLGGYGALSALLLGGVAVLAATGRTATPFMWSRAAAVLASAAVLHWLTGRAERGGRRAYERVRTLTRVLPPAIVVVDVVFPGLPVWFVVVQTACALILAATAFPISRPEARP
ncbi:hypothetical protein [Actinomadura atramentaria]|uniref:hypothetical protein n=1 Tax=Actinomadura atramentaria TaxID=1990 RepID=UPI00035F2C2E|nr:hypothetical protein [Actinomadura atramentaria]